MSCMNVVASNKTLLKINTMWICKLIMKIIWPSTSLVTVIFEGLNLAFVSFLTRVSQNCMGILHYLIAQAHEICKNRFKFSKLVIHDSVMLNGQQAKFTQQAWPQSLVIDSFVDTNIKHVPLMYAFEREELSKSDYIALFYFRGNGCFSMKICAYDSRYHDTELTRCGTYHAVHSTACWSRSKGLWKGPVYSFSARC